MTRSARDMVAEFHRVMEQPIAEAPTVADRATRQLRYALIEEELSELWIALGDVLAWPAQGMSGGAPDIVAIADALGDLKVVIEGAALAFGIDLDAVVAEIHRSNMSKLGLDGRPIKRADGKVLKGPNYSPPDIARVLRDAAFAAGKGATVVACSVCDHYMPLSWEGDACSRPAAVSPDAATRCAGVYVARVKENT